MFLGGKTRTDDDFTCVTLSLPTHSPIHTPWEPLLYPVGQSRKVNAIITLLPAISHQIFIKNIPYAEYFTEIWSTEMTYLHYSLMFFQNNYHLILISSKDLSRTIICAHLTHNKTNSQSDYESLNVLEQLRARVGLDRRSPEVWNSLCLSFDAVHSRIIVLCQQGEMRAFTLSVFYNSPKFLNPRIFLKRWQCPH